MYGPTGKPIYRLSLGLESSFLPEINFQLIKRTYETCLVPILGISTLVCDCFHDFALLFGFQCDAGKG